VAINTEANQNSNHRNTVQSLHNQPVRIADERFIIGEMIEYGPRNDKKFAIKVGELQYVDAKTRAPISFRQIAPYISDPTYSKRVTYQKYINSGSTNRAFANTNYRRQKVVLDFETAITDGSGEYAKPADIYSTGLAELTTDERTGAKILRAEDHYTIDVFDDLLNQNDPNKSNTARSNIDTMSKKIQKNYFNHINKLAKKHNINLGGAASLNDVIRNETALRKVVDKVHELGIVNIDTTPQDRNDFRKIAGTLGADKTNIKSTLTTVNRLREHMTNKWHIDPNSNTSPVLAAYNPTQDNRALNTIFRDAGDTNRQRTPSERLSIEDIRGSQMVINSAVMPELTNNMTTTFGPMLDDIADRLNMSNKSRKKFFDNMSRNIDGVYTPRSAADDILSKLNYAVADGNKTDFNPTFHNAAKDSAQEIRIIENQKRFYNKAVKESMMPSQHFQSVKSRYLSAHMLQQAEDAIAYDRLGINYTNKSSWKGKILKPTSGSVDINVLSKRIQSKFESNTSYKIEKNMLESNIRQFGGSTIGHLLGGALLFAGIRKGVKKARELFADDKAHNTEGLRHDSIMTAVRRLGISDFGSGRLLGALTSPGSIKAFKRLFRQKLKNPQNTINIIRKSLKNINKNIIQKYRQEAGGTFRQLIKDKDRMSKVVNETLGPQGATSKLLTNLTRRNKISPQLAYKISNVNNKALEFGSTFVNSIKNIKNNPNAAMNAARKKIDKGISSIFVNKDNKLKASGIAIALGGIGGLGIMLARGSYDPKEMKEPLPTQDERRFRRDPGYSDTLRQMRNDIRNSNQEGIALGSRDRQKSRYEYTDFGSGYRGLITNIRKFSQSLYKRGNQLFEGTANTAAKIVNSANVTAEKLAAMGIGKKVNIKPIVKATKSGGKRISGYIDEAGNKILFNKNLTKKQINKRLADAYEGNIYKANAKGVPKKQKLELSKAQTNISQGGAGSQSSKVGRNYYKLKKTTKGENTPPALPKSQTGKMANNYTPKSSLNLSRRKVFNPKKGVYEWKVTQPIKTASGVSNVYKNAAPINVRGTQENALKGKTGRRFNPTPIRSTASQRRQAVANKAKQVSNTPDSKFVEKIYAPNHEAQVRQNVQNVQKSRILSNGVRKTPSAKSTLKYESDQLVKRTPKSNDLYIDTNRSQSLNSLYKSKRMNKFRVKNDRWNHKLMSKGIGAKDKVPHGSMPLPYDSVLI